MLFTANVPSVDDGRAILATQQQLFLLDTATGKVWKFLPNSQMQTQQGEKQLALTEMFSPLFVAQTDQEASQHTLDASNTPYPFRQQSESGQSREEEEFVTFGIDHF